VEIQVDRSMTGVSTRTKNEWMIYRKSCW
jgi:hypothetical protein